MKKGILSLFVIFLIFTSCNEKEDTKSNEIVQENKIVDLQVQSSEKISLVEPQNEKTEPFWIEEIKKNTYGITEPRFFVYNNYLDPVDEHAFNYKVELMLQMNEGMELIELKLGEDILLDDKIGYLYFYYNQNKYLYVPGDNYPFTYLEGSQNIVQFSQDEISSVRWGKFQLNFFIKNINVSSYLTETTKNGEWEYDGQEIERFPIVFMKDENEVYYKKIPQPWVEGKTDDGIGEWIEFETFGHNTLFIVNGFVDVRRTKLFKDNNRVKIATLVCTPKDKNKQPFEVKIEFEDFAYIKTIKIPEVCTKFRFIIDEVYKGSKYSDTVITSIYVPDTVDAP